MADHMGHAGLVDDHLDHVQVHIVGPGLVPRELGAASGVVTESLAGATLGGVGWAGLHLAPSWGGAEPTSGLLLPDIVAAAVLGQVSRLVTLVALVVRLVESRSQLGMVRQVVGGCFMGPDL